MKITRKFAFEFWEAIYGNKDLVSDCFGDRIYKEDYGDTEIKRRLPGKKAYHYGWTLDHILPLSKGGDKSLNNLEIMHWINNSQKGDKTSFFINDIEYEIHKCKSSIEGYKGYGIQEKQSKQRIDWKSKYKMHF